MLWPLEAAGQPVCDLRYKVVALLDTKYGEAVVAGGLSSAGALIEVFENPETTTWTITVTAPGGPTCLVGEGDGWKWIELEKLLEGTAS